MDRLVLFFLVINIFSRVFWKRSTDRLFVTIKNVLIAAERLERHSVASESVLNVSSAPS